jgi:quercetin dioxygenase-like cupin family protein
MDRRTQSTSIVPEVNPEGKRKMDGVVYVSKDGTAVLSPEPGMQRQVLAFNQNLMLVRHNLLKGWQGARHKHSHDQLVYVVSGAILFTVDGKTVELHGGDSIVAAGDIEHEASALEDSEVLDVFTPYREDYAL